MVDKPKGKVETLLEKFFGICRNAVCRLDEKTAGHRKMVNMCRGNHPKISRAIVVTVCT